VTLWPGEEYRGLSDKKIICSNPHINKKRNDSKKESLKVVLKVINLKDIIVFF
jgi:hypothetical protein